MARDLTQEMLASQLRASIPRLKETLQKGQMGRLGIIGGSYEYSGAPYYAAISGYKTGSDLAYVFCCRDAGLPIKSYSSELIVLPMLRTMSEAEQDFRLVPGDALTKDQYNQVRDQIVSDLQLWLRPLHALVVGPGLGRDPLVLDCARAAIIAAKERELPIVLDGDALWAINTDLDIIQGYTRAILTPNIVEYKRLYNAVALENERPNDSSAESSEAEEMASSSQVPSSPKEPLSPLSQSTDNLANQTEQVEKTETPASNEPTTTETVVVEQAIDQSTEVKPEPASAKSKRKRPSSALNPEAKEEEMLDSKTVKKVAAYLGGVTILLKGEIDIITDGKRTIQCTREGGLRRCGGQGDILAGITGTLVGWNHGPLSAYELAEKIKKREGHKFTASRTMLAAWGACTLTREASHRAFEDHHRGTTTVKLLEHIGPAFYDICEHHTDSMDIRVSTNKMLSDML